MHNWIQVLMAVSELFLSDDLPCVFFSAPMVRYTKLPFRTLVRKYGCHVAYTPMIIANSFIRSERCRDVEFVTNEEDRPLVAQFASNNPTEFGIAAEMLRGYVEAVDINCGCPQKWIIDEGLGVALEDKTDLVVDMIKCAKQRSQLPVAVKMRIKSDLRKSVEFAKAISDSGAAWITVHGRTRDMKREPVVLEGVKLIKESVSCPVVHNGDIFSLSDAIRIQEETNVDGVMAGRGLLQNPSLFSGQEDNPLDVISEFVKLSLEFGIQKYEHFHKQLGKMLQPHFSSKKMAQYSRLPCTASVLDFLWEHNIHSSLK